MAIRTYGILWRWHFLAGLLACPVLLVLAVTGAIYVFQPELERAISPELHVVEPGPRLPADALAARIPASCTPTSFNLHPDPTRSVVVWCAGEGSPRVFLDPSTGEVLGRDVWADSVFGFVLELHWDLTLGTRGALVVEWATSWALLLMLSGAYLWWPRRRRGGTWWPRRRVAARQRLRDLHAVFGAYAVPALFAIAASGLFWTQLAGKERWKHAVGDEAAAIWEARPRSAVVPGADRIGYDRAFAAAGYDATRSLVSISIGGAADAAYTVYRNGVDDGSPSESAFAFVDAYSGRVLARFDWDDRSLLGKLDASGYAIHVGAIAGLPGRILALLAALVLAALCITGPWMWWKRRPRGGLGIPPRAERFAWPLLAAFGVLGWVLPTVGYTLLAVLAFELGFFAARRVLQRRTT